MAEASRPPDFLEALARRPLLLDGGMGTRLYPGGLAPAFGATAVCALTRPDDVLAIHRRDLAAGADAILTDTFLAQPSVLATYREQTGSAPSSVEVIHAAVELARRAAGPGRFVIGSIGPPILPPGEWRKARHGELVREQAVILNDAGVDALMFETLTMMNAPMVLRHVRDVARVPVLVSLYAWPAGRGARALADRARRLVDLGADVVGCNCNRLADAIRVISILSGAVSVPLIARPNAGQPGGPLDGPSAFAAAVPKWLESGARLIGGCCGTTEAHVAAMREALDRALANSQPPTPELH